MPIDGLDPEERLINELVSKQLIEQASKRPKPQPKPETCPYCGSAELEHHHVPLERTLMIVTCLDCGETWDKE